MFCLRFEAIYVVVKIFLPFPVNSRSCMVMQRCYYYYYYNLLQLLFGSLDFVQDYQGEPVPER